MIPARPSVSEERWLTLAARHPETREAIASSGEGGTWRCATLLTRCLFFTLGVFSAGLTYTIFNLLQIPVPGIFAGLTLLGTAEWLIARRRLHASGIEEALWACGAALAVFELLEEIGALDELLGLMVMAVVLVIAGWRLLNPLFTTIAAAVASLAIVTVSNPARPMDEEQLASLLCFAGAFFALAAGARKFRRPSFDRMSDWLVVALPVLGYFWSLWGGGSSPTWDALREGSLTVFLSAALVLAYGLTSLTLGIRRRAHAPLIATLACALLLAVELRAITGLTLHWRLILWGSLALVVAIVIERWLREPRDGITSRGIEESTTALDLLQMGGAAIALPSSGNAGTHGTQTPGVTGQGGEFGGGGASGRF